MSAFFIGAFMEIFYFFGDSITLGVNVLPKDSFYQLTVEELQNKYTIPPAKFYNLGACKNSSKEILARFGNEFSARNLPGSTPIFILMCGVVDTMKFTLSTYLDREESTKCFADIIKAAQKHGRIIAVSPSPVADEEQNTRLQDLIRAQQNICLENGCPYVNIFPSLHNGEYLAELKDGVHPGKTGNALIAKYLIPALKEVLF